MLFGTSPFTEVDGARLREQIITADYVFPPNPKISEEARDLIQKLLVVDPEERLSSEQILRHPWLQVTGNTGVWERFNVAKCYSYRVIKYFGFFY